MSEQDTSICDDETNTCEQCGKVHHWSESQATVDDCYLCKECQAHWEKEVFGKCPHEWGIHDSDHVVCHKCSGVMHKDNL